MGAGRALFACVLIAGPALAAAAIPAVVERQLPADRAVFRVGLAELDGEDLSPEARVAAATFPRLLYELVSEIDERDLSTDELNAYATVRLDSVRRTAANRLRAAVEARDRLLFETPPATPAARTSAAVRAERAETAVRDARELLDTLESVSPADVPAEPRRRIEYWAGHADSRVLTIGSSQPADIAARENLDLLIRGTIEEIEGYLIVDLFAFHRFLATEVLIGGAVARPEELGLEAEAVAGEVAHAVLGRQFATLVVETGDPRAAVSVNGALRGFGRVTAPYLRPGSQMVRVERDGSAVTRVFELEPGGRVVERVELSAPAARRIRLQSSPPGANVYADSVWIGRTPMEYEFATRPTVVRLRRDGYLESRFVIDDAAPQVITRVMLPDTVDWTEELHVKRDAFYRSLTWFVLSLPVTVLLNGGYDSVQGGYLTIQARANALLDRRVLHGLTPDEQIELERLAGEQERLARRGNLLFWATTGSRLINVGLFINLLISIFDYVAVGEGPHNQ